MDWWYGKIIIIKKFQTFEQKFNLTLFDDLITYLIISIILDGRLGYVIFYDMNYYLKNPLILLKFGRAACHFHGAMLGIIVGTYIFSKKQNIKTFFLLDIIACVSPIGIFLGRIANFINSELVGKASDVYWAVIFPKIDNVARHPS